MRFVRQRNFVPAGQNFVLLFPFSACLIRLWTVFP